MEDDVHKRLLVNERTIKWVKENKGKTVEYKDGFTIKTGTVVGYNSRNGLIIMRNKDSNCWKNLDFTEGEDVLVWTRFNTNNYFYTYSNPCEVIP